MREFPIIDSATSVDQLRMRLKDTELEQYGESFIPEYVYDVIKGLPRFSSMRVSSLWSPNELILTESSAGTSKMQKNFLVSCLKDCMTSVLMS